jgi:hypothetical protein
VHGEFRPLGHLTCRPLQPTGKAHESWAAIPDEQGTRFGRYDTKRFAFRAVLTLPGVWFNSMMIWVDVESSAAYLAVNGDLIRIPLRPATASPDDP